MKAETHKEKERHEPDKRFARLCPLLHRAIHGRRYLLPNYRQGDYTDQKELDCDFELGLIAIGMGALGYGDDVHNCQYANYCEALHYDRPVMFLERELGEALMRTELPKGMMPADINWCWPQFRVMVPKGLVTIRRDGEPRSLLYLDMCLVSERGVQLPSKYSGEMENYVVRSKMELAGGRVRTDKLVVKMDETYLCAVGQIDYSEVGFGRTTYAYTAPWQAASLDKLVSYRGGLNTALDCDEDDEAFLVRLKHLALNVLLFLSDQPNTYVPKVVRRQQQKGDRVTAALHTANFVGQSQVKPIYIRSRYEPEGAISGRLVKAHWVCGHWTRQPYGPRQSLRRWQWIQPYHTFGPE